MINRRKKWMKALLPLALAALLAGCGDNSSPSASAPRSGGGKPVIVVSIYPIASLVNELTDNWATVRTLMPPETNPQNFVPGAAQAQMLRDADVLIVVGMHLDHWALRQAQAVGKPGLKVIDFADLLKFPRPRSPGCKSPEGDPEGLNGLAGGGGAVTPPESPLPAPAPRQGSDPTSASAYTGPNNHLWMDPLLADQFIYDLDVELKPFFPGQDCFPSSPRAVDGPIAESDQEMAAKLSALPNKRMVTYGNALIFGPPVWLAGDRPSEDHRP